MISDGTKERGRMLRLLASEWVAARVRETEHLWANHNQIIYNHSLNKLRAEKEGIRRKLDKLNF